MNMDEFISKHFVFNLPNLLRRDNWINIICKIRYVNSQFSEGFTPDGVKICQKATSDRCRTAELIVTNWKI